MFIDLILITLAGYFAKEAYDDGRIGWAMFWSMLLGWDLHVLITHI